MKIFKNPFSLLLLVLVAFFACTPMREVNLVYSEGVDSNSLLQCTTQMLYSCKGDVDTILFTDTIKSKNAAIGVGKSRTIKVPGSGSIDLQILYSDGYYGSLLITNPSCFTQIFIERQYNLELDSLQPASGDYLKFTVCNKKRCRMDFY